MHTCQYRLFFYIFICKNEKSKFLSNKNLEQTAKMKEIFEMFKVLYIQLDKDLYFIDLLIGTWKVSYSLF